MRCGIVALGIACMTAGVAAQPPPASIDSQALVAIDACVERLDPALDVGYERIAARCPQLARALQRSGWAEWLPRGWQEARNDLSAGSLAELRTLVARELETSPGPQQLDVQRLDQVLNGLGPEAQERSSLWSRFRAWLRTVVERNRQADDRSWLDKMIQRHGRSQTFIEVITYATFGVIFVLACVIVVNELRAAGFLRARVRKTTGFVALDPIGESRVTWKDVENALATEKPRLLLELVIAKLMEQRRLPPAGALTVREVARNVQLTEADDRARLNDVALAAERARYAAHDLAPDTVEHAVASGRALLQRLKDAPTPALPRSAGEGA